VAPDVSVGQFRPGRTSQQAWGPRPGGRGRWGAEQPEGAQGRTEAAAGSLREGLAETLTVLRLDVAATLARMLRSTNSIGSMISIARNHSMIVKNWQNGTMALRWCAAGMLEASKQFRHVSDHLHLPALRGALDARHRTRRGDGRISASGPLGKCDLAKSPRTTRVRRLQAMTRISLF